MDREAWWATVHGVTRVRYDLATKPSHHKKLFCWGTTDQNGLLQPGPIVTICMSYLTTGESGKECRSKKPP